jgi:hypothetical protein
MTRGNAAKWRLRRRAVADSLEEAGKPLFTFLALPVGAMALAQDHG